MVCEAKMLELATAHVECGHLFFCFFLGGKQHTFGWVRMKRSFPSTTSSFCALRIASSVMKEGYNTPWITLMMLHTSHSSRRRRKCGPRQKRKVIDSTDKGSLEDVLES